MKPHGRPPQIYEVFQERDAVWRENAACRGVDSDIFFPERGHSTGRAHAICSRCPVTEECLEYALHANIKLGVWGGKSERQRRMIRRTRVALRRAS